MSLLKEPINRAVYDFIVKSPHVVSLFDRYLLSTAIYLANVKFNFYLFE